MTKLLETPMSRRNILQAATAGALTIAPALRAAVYAKVQTSLKKKKCASASFPSPIAQAW